MEYKFYAELFDNPLEQDGVVLDVTIEEGFVQRRIFDKNLFQSCDLVKGTKFLLIIKSEPGVTSIKVINLRLEKLKRITK